MCDCRNGDAERGFSSYFLPGGVVESYLGGGDEFLERPATGEPHALGEGVFAGAGGDVVHGEVGEEGVADVRFGVPAVHGVDGLGELGTACLVYAACVYPGVREAVGEGLLAGA